MRRLALLLLVLPLAACGGGGGVTTVTKRPPTRLVAAFRGVLKGTARLQARGSKQTAVTIDLGTGTGSRTVSAELDRGSCGKALRLEKPLGTMRNSTQSWSVTEALSTLTASPLAVVIRGARHGVVSCAQIGR